MTVSELTAKAWDKTTRDQKRSEDTSTTRVGSTAMTDEEQGSPSSAETSPTEPPVLTMVEGASAVDSRRRTTLSIQEQVEVSVLRCRFEEDFARHELAQGAFLEHWPDLLQVNVEEELEASRLVSRQSTRGGRRLFARGFGCIDLREGLIHRV
jgi:hypothetical protein